MTDTDPRPMIIDPADEHDNPPERAGLHVIVTRLDDGFVVLDEYEQRRPQRPRDVDHLLDYLATELLGHSERPGRYRVDLPNDARNWPIIDDVIITDEPMGPEGVYMAWAADATRWGYGMPGSQGRWAVGDRERRRAELAARHAAGSRDLAARYRAERQALAQEVGDDELCPPEWVETGSMPDEPRVPRVRSWRDWHDERSGTAAKHDDDDPRPPGVVARERDQEAAADELLAGARRDADRRTDRMVAAVTALAEMIAGLREDVNTGTGEIVTALDESAAYVARGVEDALDVHADIIEDALEQTAGRYGRARLRAVRARRAELLAEARERAQSTPPLAESIPEPPPR